MVFDLFTNKLKPSVSLPPSKPSPHPIMATADVAAPPAEPTTAAADAPTQPEGASLPPHETIAANHLPPGPETAEGPLRTLAHKAASTGLVRRARQGVPSFAEPAVSRTASRADAVLHTVDGALAVANRTFQSDEGRRLAESAAVFLDSLRVFLGMLATRGLGGLEQVLGVEYEDAGRQVPCASKRVATVARVAGNKLAERVEKREKEVEGTFEADVYGRMRWFLKVLLAVFLCMTKALANYAGPGNEYVAPFAERVLTVLPQEGEDEHSLAVDSSSALSNAGSADVLQGETLLAS